MFSHQKIKNQESLDKLIGLYREHIGWIKNRPHQRDLDRAINYIIKHSKEMHRLLEKYRLELHVPRTIDFQCVDESSTHLKKDPEMLYYPSTLKNRFMPVLEALARTEKKRNSLENPLGRVGRLNIQEFRRIHFKELFKIWDGDHRFNTEFVECCVSFCEAAGDDVDEEVVRKSL